MGILHGSVEVPNQKWAPITKICLLEHLPSSSHLTYSFTSVFLDHVTNKLNALESLSLFGGRKRMLCLKCIQDKCMSVHRETWGSYIERWWCLSLWANLQRFSLQTFLYYCDYYYFSSDVIFINFLKKRKNWKYQERGSFKLCTKNRITNSNVHKIIYQKLSLTIVSLWLSFPKRIWLIMTMGSFKKSGSS